ncbi:hypothetical protein Tco_1378655 [Tanacetum coccineum]
MEREVRIDNEIARKLLDVMKDLDKSLTKRHEIIDELKVKKEIFISADDIKSFLLIMFLLVMFSFLLTEIESVGHLVMVVLVAALAPEFVLGFAPLESGLSQLDL